MHPEDIESPASIALCPLTCSEDTRYYKIQPAVPYSWPQASLLSASPTWRRLDQPTFWNACSVDRQSAVAITYEQRYWESTDVLFLKPTPLIARLLEAAARATISSPIVSKMVFCRSITGQRRKNEASCEVTGESSPGQSTTPRLGCLADFVH
jgi:hypothetical protein